MTAGTETFVIAADHPALDGHFPGRPIVPGALLLDAALAAVGRLTGLHPPLRLHRVKFHAFAGPGALVEITVERRPSGAVAFACAADGERLVSGTAEAR